MLARIRKNDTVLVISGKDKGKQGTILEICPQKDKVMVRGVAICVRHCKARKAGEVPAIKKEEGYLASSKVMPVCRSCKKPTRIQIKRTNQDAVRTCCHCKAAFE
jgi:large subunit ribosomal protein L24